MEYRVANDIPRKAFETLCHDIWALWTNTSCTYPPNTTVLIPNIGVLHALYVGYCGSLAHLPWVVAGKDGTPGPKGDQGSSCLGRVGLLLLGAQETT